MTARVRLTARSCAPKSPSSGAKRTNCASCTALSVLNGKFLRTKSHVVGLGGQDHVRPLGVGLIQLVAAMRSVSMLTEFLDLEERVARATAHRGSFGDVSSGASHVPRLAR